MCDPCDWRCKNRRAVHFLMFYFNTVSIDFSVTIVIGKQSGSKCVIRVVGGATPSNNVFFVKRIIKIPLPLKNNDFYLYFSTNCLKKVFSSASAGLPNSAKNKLLNKLYY